MPLLSFLCSKTNGVLSRLRPSGSSFSARRDSSPNASSFFKRTPSNDTDLSCANTGPSNDPDISYANILADSSITSNGDTDYLSTSNMRDNWSQVAASPDPAGSVQELATPASSRATCPLRASRASRCTEWSTDVTPRRRPTEDSLFLSSSSTRRESHSLGSSDPRYAALEVALDLFDNARSERYKAVEGMLHFLDAEAEHRVSSSSRT